MEKPEEQPEIELEEESSDDESSISIVDDESPKEQPEIELEEESSDDESSISIVDDETDLSVKAEEEKKDLKVQILNYKQEHKIL